MPTKEKKFDSKAYAEEVKEAQEEAKEAVQEPISADITESEWELRKQRLGADDAKWLFAVVEEHGGPNIVADPEPEDEEYGALDETYRETAAKADTGKAEEKDKAESKGSTQQKK